MKKKTYQAPAINVIVVKHQCSLLAGSANATGLDGFGGYGGDGDDGDYGD